MKPIWFRPRSYGHLDAPVGQDFAKKAEHAKFVAQHSFLPLLRYTKETKRYRPLDGKTTLKKRPIMYASHRDACIFSRYAFELGKLLDAHYETMGLAGCVIAYRHLKKSNYGFAADIRNRAISMAPCTILCFDVSDFFGTLDHRLLKSRLKRILGVTEIPPDWYSIFRQVTRFTYVELDALKKHPLFSPRFKNHCREPLATIAEVLDAGIPLTNNKTGIGIPQGTPISSAFSNLYMLDFDAAMLSYCSTHNAVFRRYSDDILILCPNAAAAETEQFVKERIAAECLAINNNKTERHVFGPGVTDPAQYLGFNLTLNGATIRQSSLARQWRKVRKSIRHIKKAGLDAIAAGKAGKIFTKTLRRRFTSLPVRNFSSYARRSADALEAPQIRRQVRRLERYVETELAKFPTKEP